MSKSLNFPFLIGARGAAVSSSGNDLLRQKIEQVLFTIPGERVGRPLFGAGIQRLVFAGADDVAAAEAEYTIGRALRQALGDEIDFEAVRVTASDSELLIDILFTDRASGAPMHMATRQPLEAAP